jgi:hypothetical protein
MKVKYRVIDYRPQHEWISVEFTHPDRPEEPWVREFSFPDFSKEKLVDHLTAVAAGIAGTWARIPNHPAELPIPNSGELDVMPELYLPYEPNPQYAPEPEWDQWTQELLPGEVWSPLQETIEWVVRDLSPEEQAQRVEEVSAAYRQERDYLLMKSDHIFCSDVEVSDKKAWIDYRQELRDMTSQPNFPKEFDWPVPPDCKQTTGVMQ